MENKLEQLLNSLVDAWWKPRWLLNEIEYIHAFDDVNQWWRVEISYGDHWYYKSLRQIASRESNLWQFVCENGMVDRHNYDSKTYEVRIENWIKRREVWPEWKVSINNSWRWRWSYLFRLIESSLKDESELEEFLLSNIKVDVENRW